MPHLPFGSGFEARAVSPFREMGAYEVLWSDPGARHSGRSRSGSPSSLAASRPTSCQLADAEECAAFVQQRFAEAQISHFGVRVHGAGEYPEKLRDAAHPIELLYYQGWWDLVASRSVAHRRHPQSVTGRHLSHASDSRANSSATISPSCRGWLLGSIGRSTIPRSSTEGARSPSSGRPCRACIPRSTNELQRCIADDFLVISPVPVKRYESQDYRRNRFFFPERNAVMSALTEATIIVEAGETSGTLTQARAALQQGRKLLILDSCFRSPHLTWPARLEAKGAVRVREYGDVQRALCG